MRAGEGEEMRGRGKERARAGTIEGEGEGEGEETRGRGRGRGQAGTRAGTWVKTAARCRTFSNDLCRVPSESRCVYWLP